MKNKLRYTMAVVGLLLSMSAAQAADTYTIDPNHTAVVWSISHFEFSHPSGKFANITGTLTLDQQTPQNSKVVVTIPLDHFLTGIDKLEEHLKSPAFFDTATYPTASFVSSKVTLTGKDTATVDGMLTLHGVTKPETLTVKLNKIGTNMMNKQTAGFSATTTIKRSDFGMTTYLPGLGDEVKLTIDSEANL